MRDVVRFILRGLTQLDDLNEGFIATEEERDLYTALQSALVNRKTMLNEEVFNLVYHCLNNNQNIRSRFARLHVLVDDYHTLCKASQAVIELLTIDSLTVTGCVNETAHFSNDYAYEKGFVEFTCVHQSAEEYQLTKSLRCADKIVACGNSLILNSDMDRSALMDSSPETGRGEITLVKWPAPTDEAEGIAGYLKSRLSNPSEALSENDIFIAVPNQSWGKSIAKALAKVGIRSSTILRPGILPGDPRVYARCKNLLTYTLLNLLADSTDLVAWRNWCGFGDSLTRSNLWLKLEDFAKERGLHELKALEILSESGERPFPEVDVLVQRYLEAQDIIAADADKTGHALINAITPRGETFPPKVLSLIKPVIGNETASDFYQRATRSLMDPIFDNNDRVRIGLWSTLAGLTVTLLVLPGLVNGFAPPGAAFDTATFFGNPSVIDIGRRSFYTTLTKASDELILSYFHKAPQAEAEALGVCIARIRMENGCRMASVQPSIFLDEMGDSLPTAASMLPTQRAKLMPS